MTDDVIEAEGIETVDVPPERAEIRVTADNLHGATSEAEATLIGADAPIFQRGERLVIPISTDEIASDSRRTKTPAFKMVEADMLRDHLSRVAVFRQFKPLQREPERWVKIPPPKDVAAMLLSRAGEWQFRPIAGVITTPTMRPNGSILIEEGYDEATQLYHIVDPNVDLRLLDIPLKPSREIALDCLNDLQQLLVEFPFKTKDDADGGVDLAVALSAILSAVMVGAVPMRPMHTFSAPEIGTGKSYLCDIIGAFANGNYCPAIAAGKDPIETDKRLDSLLLRGLPLISIDNVEGPLGTPTLNLATERPVMEVRPLGSSRLERIANRSMFLATGNNFHVKTDMARRTLRAEMDAGDERPETRKFKFDPYRMVVNDRALYIAAVMTLVRAYLVSGETVDVTPFQSYAEYNRFVREPLVWLGCAEPVKSIEKVRADDPDRRSMLMLLSAWYAVFDDDPISAAAVIDRTKPREGFAEDDVAISELREALRATAGDRSGGISSLKLGLWLRDHRDRRIAGYQLLAMPGRAHTSRWQVVRTDDDGDRVSHRDTGGGGHREYLDLRADLADARSTGKWRH